MRLRWDFIGWTEPATGYGEWSRGPVFRPMMRWRARPLVGAGGPASGRDGWRANRATPGEIAPLTAIGLLGLAKLLPEAWFNFLFYRLLTMTRARRVDHGKYQSAP